MFPYFGGCKADPPGLLERFAAEQAKHKLFVRNEITEEPSRLHAREYAGWQRGICHYCVACMENDGQENRSSICRSPVARQVPSLGSVGVQSYTMDN